MRFSALILTLLWSASIAAQTRLDARINKHLAAAVFKHANVSVSVVDLESGSILGGHNEEKVLIPASSLKVLTTLSALDILGSDYTYKTTISFSGKVIGDGTLEGNLYIEGSGDPTLGSDRIEGNDDYKKLIKRIVKAVQEYGITCIDGEVIADESIYNSYPISPSWQWNDLGNYYAAGAWGININENQYRIYFDRRATVKRQPRLRGIDPQIPGIHFFNEVLVDSANTPDNAYIFGGPYNYEKRIVGTIPAGEGSFVIRGSIPDPPFFMAHLLGEALNKVGIQSNGSATQYHPKKEKRNNIYEILSPTLDEIVIKANHESNNLYCESLLKTIATVEASGGSGGVGIYLIKKNLTKHRINTMSLHMEDGSGLSARNQVSSLLLAKFLQKYALKFENMKKVLRYFPSAGQSGTLRRMFGKSPARGKVWAKSGYMDRVLSYTGYIKSKSGRWRSFSVIVNGYSVDKNKMRTKLEKLITDIYLYS